MPRILTSDQWADYLIFRLYPRQRVFFDGRSDFFGPAIGSDYRKLLAGEKSWRELLDRYQFDLALLPQRLGVEHGTRARTRMAAGLPGFGGGTLRARRTRRARGGGSARLASTVKTSASIVPPEARP